MLSDDEQDRWRHIEHELAEQGRLVRLSKKLTLMHVGPGMPIRTCVFWVLGGLTGLIILVAGSLTHAGDLIAAGVVVLIVTVLVAGVLLIVIGTTARRGQHPLADE